MLTPKKVYHTGPNRVNSISIVHQKLYQGAQLGAIEMKDYLLNLSESILDSFGVEEQITLVLEMDQLDLEIDTAIPLGLIINDLFINAVKYASPDSRHGSIIIILEKQADHILYLNLTDDGVGKHDEIKGTGFGSPLIKLLPQQLNCQMEELREKGTSISFQLKGKKK
jgi:two-component sensor histidine kinase